MPYVLDPSKASVVFSSKLYDLSYTESGTDLSPILWPSRSGSASWSDYAPILPDDPVLPLGVQNFDTLTSPLWQLVSSSDPQVSSTQVSWGDSTTGLTFFWTPSQTYATQQALEAALADLVNSNENGTLDRVVAYENGEKLLEATFTDTAATLEVGELSISLLGQWNRGFQDLLDYAEALNDYTSLLEYALDGLPERPELKTQTLAILNQYSLDQTTVKFADEIAFQATTSATQTSLKIGNAELFVTGKISSDLGDLLDLVEALPTLQTLIDAAGSGTLEDYVQERAFAVDLLSKYALYEAGYRLNGETQMSWSLGTDEILFNILGATIRLEGEFPVSDYGALFDVALDVYATDFAGVPNFDLVDGLDLNTLEILDDQGAVVIGAYAPPAAPSPTIADVGVLQGTAGSDEFVYDEFTRNVLSRVIDLDAGDDVVKFSSGDELWGILNKIGYTNQWGSTWPETEWSTAHNNAYFASDIAGSSVAVDVFGGTGYDEIRLLEHDDDWGSYYIDYTTELYVDFAAGTILAKNREATDGKIADVTIHDIHFQDIERISFENGQTIRAVGDASDNELAMFVSQIETWTGYEYVSDVTSQSVPKDFVYDGGGGIDTLILTSDQAFDPMVAMRGAINSYVGQNTTGNEFLFTSTSLDSSIQLNDVEFIRFESIDGRVQTLTVSDMAGTTSYNGGVTIVGDAVDGQRLKADTTIRDPDGVGNLTYDWYRDYELVSNSSYLDLNSSDIGSRIMLEVTYTDGAGNEEVLSDVVLDSVASFDRGDASTYVTETFHLANQSETQINHGAVEIVTAEGTIETDNYYWGTDIPTLAIAPDEQFSVQVAADLAGSVEITDVISQLRHIVGLNQLSGLNAVAADADYDGSIGISDVIQNLRTIVGLSKPEKAKVFDVEGNDTFTLDTLNTTLYVIAPGDVDLNWVPPELI